MHGVPTAAGSHRSECQPIEHQEALDLSDPIPVQCSDYESWIIGGFRKG